MISRTSTNDIMKNVPSMRILKRLDFIIEMYHIILEIFIDETIRTKMIYDIHYRRVSKMSPNY